MEKMIVAAAASGHSGWEIATFVVTVVGVIAVIVYTVYAKRQAEISQKALDHALASSATALEQTRRSNDAAEKSGNIAARNLILEHRSWLVPSSKKGITLSDEGLFVMTLVNKGGVPCILGRSAVHGIVVAEEKMATIDMIRSMQLEIPEDRFMDAGVVLAQGDKYRLGSPMPQIGRAHV